MRAPCGRCQYHRRDHQQRRSRAGSPGAPGNDDDLRAHVWLTPANSINLGRLLPQVFYYFLLTELAFDAVEAGSGLVVSVPSGNFGNLTAGLIAKRIGLPIARFVASTNVNDVVPQYLDTGTYHPRASVRTVARPSRSVRRMVVCRASSRPVTSGWGWPKEFS